MFRKLKTRPRTIHRGLKKLQLANERSILRRFRQEAQNSQKSYRTPQTSEKIKSKKKSASPKGSKRKEVLPRESLRLLTEVKTPSTLDFSLF